MKRLFPVLILVLITAISMTAASPVPDTKIDIVQELPLTMHVGEVQTVVVDVTSNQEFLLAQAMPSFAYPGKGVVAVQGGEHAGRGTSASLEVTFEAKSSTANMQDGVAKVYVVVGVRYPGGYVDSKQFVFNVTVP